MKPTLLILAAGIGSRYGGMKQIDQVGPSGEAIIDYSIYDAIRAGFGRIVFVIRKNIEQDFIDFFGEKLKGRIPFEFAYQELDMVPEGFTVPEERKKPWGTAHAVWVAREVINEPFVVINADDFYGRGSYQSVANYLSDRSTGPENHCMVGFQIKHTLSDFGTVSRGICEVDDQDFLKAVEERTEIGKSDSGIYFKDETGADQPMTGEEMVSMNIWGFSPAIFPLLEEHFVQFIHKNIDQPKAEIFIPTVINDMVKSNLGSLKVLPAIDQWFGVTYKEDKPMAIGNIRKQVDLGIYPENLWN
ncbi:MAG: nucleotidyltransferase [Bacteroidales bacterium]|nr:nucleotidyltransferase [Bacteroidales bacterium]